VSDHSVECPICHERVASWRGMTAHQRGFRCMAARATSEAIAEGLGRVDPRDLASVGLACQYRFTRRERTAPSECWTEAWIAGILNWVALRRVVRRAAVRHVLRDPSLRTRVPICPPNTFYFDDSRMQIWLGRSNELGFKENDARMHIPVPSPPTGGPNYDAWDLIFDDDGYIAFPDAVVYPPMFVVLQAQSVTMQWAACSAAIRALAEGEIL